MTRKTATRKRTRNDISRKTFSCQYFLYVSSVKIRVCQDIFLKTLDISKQRIYYHFKNVHDLKSNIPRSPLTGKHTKKVISEEDKNIVRQHISYFSAMESHYCRANTTRTYLERSQHTANV